MQLVVQFSIHHNNPMKFGLPFLYFIVECWSPPGLHPQPPAVPDMTEFISGGHKQSWCVNSLLLNQKAAGFRKTKHTTVYIGEAVVKFGNRFRFLGTI